MSRQAVSGPIPTLVRARWAKRDAEDKLRTLERDLAHALMIRQASRLAETRYRGQSEADQQRCDALWGKVNVARSDLEAAKQKLFEEEAEAARLRSEAHKYYLSLPRWRQWLMWSLGAAP